MYIAEMYTQNIDKAKDNPHRYPLCWFKRLECIYTEENNSDSTKKKERCLS